MKLEFLHQSGVQPDERLASLGIMGANSWAPETPRNNHSTTVLRGLKGISIGTLLCRDTPVLAHTHREIFSESC